jgi:nucleoside-diphosphate-sugar epimerase
MVHGDMVQGDTGNGDRPNGEARRICVTGAAGRVGRVMVRQLLEHGYDVIATDVAVASYDVRAGVIRADLTDYGQATEVLRGADAVIHLANVPAPGLLTPAATFTANVTMNFNVFHAAASLGLKRVVWAATEFAPGLSSGGGRQFGARELPPRYAPVDEDHYPLPTTTYTLSKVTSETVAEHIARWSGIPFVGLRISTILDMADYERISLFWRDPHARKWNLWSYVDVRDLAVVCRLALDADVTGSQSFVVAAADTVMNRPSARLLAEIFPDVPLTREIGEFETLLAIDRARQVLGYDPRYSWRQY